MLEADVDPPPVTLTGGANTLLAVEPDRDPLGPYTVYAIDASHAGCKLCIGDQPLLGADANGFYVSTAEYDLDPPTGSSGFFGAQIYAIDKRALAAGSDDPNVVHFEPGTQFTGRCSPRRRRAPATRRRRAGPSTSCPPRTASRPTATSIRTRSRTPSTCGR